MKYVPLTISAILTLGLVAALNMPWGKVPPIGPFLSPQHGFWQNAEAIDKVQDISVPMNGLQETAEVYLDDRLVPHVFAKNDADAYYLQGYMHARYRLWQMEFQVYAAAGRVSELVGPGGLNFDREKRRLGMVYAAERALAEIEKDPATKASVTAYTAGVNAYINSLTEAALPIEYKLLNYRPEPWTNLKCALFMKFMALDLAGSESDFENTRIRDLVGYDVFDRMFPIGQDSLDPIVPKDSTYLAEIKLHDSLRQSPPVTAPAGSDSAYLHKKDTTTVIEPTKPDKDNGSNNWAVSGRKTNSGAPIVCSDPHLGLNLPSLWFEMQLNSPTLNAYGATFPGAPGVIIGFNDSCAFGFTNAERDVRDYYEIRFKDDSRQEYWYQGQWHPTEFRYERIAMKDSPEFIDTVAYTVFGPVMFDRGFAGTRITNGKSYAVRWTAHDPSNELKFFNLLDHAHNLADYQAALPHLQTPGQNAVFASKSGDIAIVDQGSFPAKWARQGDFVMDGSDSSYAWQGMIPAAENPTMINPARGFVSSANQSPADPKTYPWYLGHDYTPYRGLILNRYLARMEDIRIEDMMRLQNDDYNIFAEMARPVMLKHIDVSVLNTEEKTYLELFNQWDLRYGADSKMPTLFELAWDSLSTIVWADELDKDGMPGYFPPASTLLEGILRDSTYEFLDDKHTGMVKETLTQDVTLAFRQAVKATSSLNSEGRAEWGVIKNTHIRHLARLDAFSRNGIRNSGGRYSLSAVRDDHGPSWRMIVQLSAATQAYGIYPGGQDGNPGSPHYDDFVQNWAEGKYYPLWMMLPGETSSDKIHGVLHAVPQ